LGKTRQQWVRGEGSSVGRRNGGRGVLCNGNQPKPYAVANFGRTLGELAGTLGKVLLALGDVDETNRSEPISSQDGSLVPVREGFGV
jgi:hypothetical protein